MRTSEKIDLLATALSAAQSEIEDAAKTGNNPHYNRKYTTLGGVWDAIRSPFAKNGLSVTQLTSQNQHGLTLNTILIHKSGQFVQGEYPIVPVKNDPQSVGSAITYARRYALMAATGVCPEDDDGNAATATSATSWSVGTQPAPAQGVPAGWPGISGGTFTVPANPNVQSFNTPPAPPATAPAKKAGSWEIPWKTAADFGKSFKDKLVKAPDLKSYTKLFGDNNDNILRLLDEDTKTHDELMGIANARKTALEGVK